MRAGRRGMNSKSNATVVRSWTPTLKQYDYTVSAFNPRPPAPTPRPAGHKVHPFHCIWSPTVNYSFRAEADIDI